jgi:hypothetical protein
MLVLMSRKSMVDRKGIYMWHDILLIGFLLLCATGLLYKGAVRILGRWGLSLWEQDRGQSLPGMAVEFLTSVFLSLMVSAALGLLFIGLAGLFGVPIDIP